MKEEKVLAVDLGGTKLLLGEVGRSGQVIETQKYESIVTNFKFATEEIEQSINNFLSNHKQDNIVGIGISAVGRIDYKNGIWYGIDKERGGVLNLKKSLEEKFEIPVAVANDVYCATLAELFIGIGNVTKNFAYINIGTGIAGRIVDQGHIITGKHFDAGEIGHMIVDIHSNEKCVCGSYGCVEPIASGLGMSNQAMKLLKNKSLKSSLKPNSQGRIDARDLFEKVDQEDEVAIKVVANALKGISALIQNVIRTCDPEAIVLGGGVMNGNWMLDHLKTYLNPETIKFLKFGVIKSDIDPNLVALKGAGLNVWRDMEK